MDYILISDSHNIAISINPTSLSHEIHSINHSIKFHWFAVLVNDSVSTIISPKEIFFSEIDLNCNLIPNNATLNASDFGKSSLYLRHWDRVRLLSISTKGHPKNCENSKYFFHDAHFFRLQIYE